MPEQDAEERNTGAGGTTGGETGPNTGAGGTTGDDEIGSQGGQDDDAGQTAAAGDWDPGSVSGGGELY
jgi:hypothetical protein